MAISRSFLSKSKLISKFSKQSSRSFSVLTEPHNNKLKNLVVSRRHQGSHLISLLSIGDNENLANFSQTHPYDYVYPAASCNNKLLMRSSCSDDTRCQPTALWNPTTRSITALPPVPAWNQEYPFCGFGFDPKSKDYEDYKVVWVMENDANSSPYYDEDFKVELYSLKTDSWKLFMLPPKHVIPIKGPTLFINGFYYWPVFYGGDLHSEEPDSGYAILRFNFANGRFCSPNIPLPDDTYDLRDRDGLSSNFIIAEFQGSLAVVAYSPADELADGDHEKPFEFEIWVWNQESFSWARRGEWALSLSAGSNDAGVERPLGLFDNDQLYLRDFMGGLVLFDCATGELTKILGIKSDQISSKLNGDMRMFAYVHSSAEEVEHTRKEEKKMKIGAFSNSTTFTSKLAPILNDDSKPMPNNNNKLKLLLGHAFEEIIYLSQISPTYDNNNNVLFNFPRFGANFYPAATCNSALLLCYIDSDFRAALWNPTTDEVKKLPDQLSPPSRILGTVWYGFGFDPKADEGDYKVIRFTNNTNDYSLDREIQAELYSLKADSWKDIASPFSQFDLPIKYPLYINGFCYWIVSRPYNKYIASFDFANETFSTSCPKIPLPPPNVANETFYNETFCHNLLVEFHGSLAALVTQRVKPFEELEIWVWNSDEPSSWSRECIIDVPVGAEKPLGLFANDQLYLQGSNGEVLLFDCTRGGELQRLGLNARGPQLGRMSSIHEDHDYIFPYVETSFPLNGKKIIRSSHKIIND